jgi:hypothetical protein
LATRTPVSTKRTNRVASKNHTSGRDRNFFLSDLIYRGLRGKYAENSDQNSKKKFSVLAGLNWTLFHFICPHRLASCALCGQADVPSRLSLNNVL